MWKKIQSEELYRHPRLILIEDTVELPDGTRTRYLKFKTTNDSVMVVCVDQDKILLQQEYSYPPNEILYQFPGGKIEDKESPEEALQRELKEEAGLRPGSLTKLGWFYIDNRRTNSRMHVFLAQNCTKTTKDGGDREEEITSQWMTAKQIDKLISEGLIVNYSVLAAWSLFRSYNP